MILDIAQRAEQDRSFAEVAVLIEHAHEIALCAHTAPDGDALGSALGLSRAISKRWPDKVVVNLLADDKDIPAIYRFLPGSDGFVRAAGYEGTPDLFICVDLSLSGRLADAEPIRLRARRTAVFDHHPSTDVFWDAGVVRSGAAAAGIIVEEFIEYLGIGLDTEMATCLFCAIMTDTGRFQYQNADAESFCVTARLIEAGASPSDVALAVYQSDRLSYLHLEAKVMGRISTFADGKIAYSYATLADIGDSGVDVNECDGLVDVVRRVAGAEIVLFLKQISPTQVRGNLRAKVDWDISRIAYEMGGGGHKAASGFTFDGDIDEALSAALPKIRALLDSGETA